MRVTSPLKVLFETLTAAWNSHGHRSRDELILPLAECRAGLAAFKQTDLLHFQAAMCCRRSPTVQPRTAGQPSLMSVSTYIVLSAAVIGRGLVMLSDSHMKLLVKVQMRPGGK